MLDLKDISVTFHANTVNERKAPGSSVLPLWRMVTLSVKAGDQRCRKEHAGKCNQRKPLRVIPERFCWMERILQFIRNINGQEKSPPVSGSL